MLAPRDLTNRDFGLAIALDWRSDPGLPEAFYAAAGDGTASEAAVSQWPLVALALSTMKIDENDGLPRVWPQLFSPIAVTARPAG